MTEFISQRKRGDAPATTIRLAVFGAAGHMGARTCSLARDDRRFQLIAEIDQAIGSDDSGAGQEPIDVIIDFSSDSGARAAAALSLSRGAALVVGTTGFVALADVMHFDQVRIVTLPEKEGGAGGKLPEHGHSN